MCSSSTLNFENFDYDGFFEHLLSNLSKEVTCEYSMVHYDYSVSMEVLENFMKTKISKDDAYKLAELMLKMVDDDYIYVIERFKRWLP